MKDSVIKCDDKDTGNRTGWTVFLVDDDPDDLYLGKLALKQSSYVEKIICVRGGSDFFYELMNQGFFSDVFSSANNCFIVLDIHMPDLDGVELLKSLKDSPSILDRNIPVFMSTGEMRTDFIAKTFDLHADGYLLKPLGANSLNQIHRVLDKRRANE